MPACLAEVTSYFSHYGIVPNHISSDAGLDYADGLPHLVFLASEMYTCVMVATSAFFPLSIPPAAAVIIIGIDRIPHINPFSSIDFSMSCLGDPVGNTRSAAASAARWPTPSPPPLPLLRPASGRPVRNSRVNIGYSADLALETDVYRVELLLLSFEKVVVPSLHFLGSADYRHSWVQDSHFCAARACSSGSFRVVHFRWAPLLGYTRAAIPTTFTFPTPKPNGGLLLVTMPSPLPARAISWMGITAPLSVARLGLMTTLMLFRLQSLFLSPSHGAHHQGPHGGWPLRGDLRGVYQL
jgi:hypothetical protein